MMFDAGYRLDGRYLILAGIGQGGMSYVYRAMDEKLMREVAIKVLREEFLSDSDSARRFRQEARAAAGLTHPNIVATYDIVDDGEYSYIVMELVDGITLKNFVASRGALSNKETVGIALQAALGLGEAHKAGIVHRDVKPQNIIITPDGKVKVSDFGIAVLSEEDEADSELVVGSAHYISPEQVETGTADARSDIYSLGITMYEMATGRVPYSGENAVDIALMHVEDTLVPPIVHSPDLSPTLNEIILKAAAKDPDERYASCDELVADLRRAADELEGGEAPGSQDVPEAHEPGTRSRVVIIAAVAALILILIAVAVSLLSTSESDPDEAVTLTEEESRTAETEMDLTISIQGEEQVPDVTGFSESLARARLSEFGLSMDSSSEEYSDIYERGTIIRQNPSPGELFSVGTTVYVTVSRGSVLDDIADDTEESARAKLTDAGFRVEETCLEDFSDEISEGRAIGVELLDSDGMRVYRESELSGVEDPQSVIAPDDYTRYTARLVISLGSIRDFAQVPELVGMDIAGAAQSLEALGLTPGSISAVHGEAPYGAVTAQSIAPGEYLRKGSALDLAVSVAGDESIAEGADISSLVADSSSSASSELSDDYYYGSIDTTVTISGGGVLGSLSQAVNVSVRLRQSVEGADEYTHIFGPIPVSPGDTIPVSFRNIRGAWGVEEGYVEVYCPDTGDIYATYKVEFAPLS